ncbi:MAG: ATP-grasp domain-containing protein [Gammaproteobacteria bacterium]
MNEYRVLLIGPRQAIVEVLRKRRIPFSIWQDKQTAHWPDAKKLVTSPLWKSTDRIRQTLNREFAGRHYTHVIAGTEAAIYPAALSRRMLGARRSETTTALRCRDKLAMKEYLCDFGIPMTRFLAESAATGAAAVFAELGCPVVRKSRKASGGRTLQIIHRESELLLQHGNRNILEKYICAPEASIESFINNGCIHFTNITGYHEKGQVNFVPAAFDPELCTAIQSLNRRVIEALKIRWGLTHLEVYLTQKGLLFGEIALRPPGGYIMNALREAYGFDPWSAFVAMELDEPFDFPNSPLAYTAVVVFHPGAGRVTAIKGARQLQDHPATREFRLKVATGDHIRPRASVGQDTGHLLYASDSPAARLELLDTFKQQFRIEIAANA